MTQERIVQVLIVDDNQDDAMILERHLSRCKKHEIKTDYAANLHETSDKLSSKHFSLIFLDNRLGGGLTAKNVLWQFRERGIDIPVVIITGVGDEQTAVDLMKSGACDYIVKDALSSEMLEKTIHNTLERHLLKVSRKRAEQELKRQKELLANVISHIPNMVFWKDTRSVYLGCNDNFARAAGLNRPEEVVGKTDHELPWEKEQTKFFLECDREVTQTGKSISNVEEPVRLADGKVVTLLTSKVPLKNADGNIVGVLGVCTDITQQKQTEQMLKGLNEKLEMTVKQLSFSNHQLEDFAHMVAHDLKAPLRAIGTLAEWVFTDSGDRLDVAGRDNLKLLLQRTVRLDRMIDGILSYSKLGHGEREEKVDVNLLLSEVIKALGLPGGIRVTVADNLPTLICDMTRMQQVFQNLITNAAEHVDEAKGRIEISCMDVDDYWQFSVNDNGPGIEQKYFDEIFQMFHKIPGRNAGKHTGIGLAIVKRIVSLYGGRIWVQSHAGKGSTFYFTFPKQTTTPEAPADTAALSQNESSETFLPAQSLPEVVEELTQ